MRRSWTFVLIGMALLWVAGGITAAADQGQAETKEAGKTTAQVEIVDYKVEEGDTLWDLSQRFYNDPWAWPLIWEMNPQVVDPHWIYPNQTLKIKALRGMTMALGKPGEKKEQIRFDIQPADIFDTSFRYDTRIDQIDMLSMETIEGSGEIINNTDEQILLGENHEIFFRMEKSANVQPGDVFTIFRIQEKIDHPSQRGVVGYMVNLLGELETTDVTTLPNGKIVYTGQIIDALSEIIVSDRLIQMDRSDIRIQLRESDLELTGTIVHGPPDKDLLLGPGKTVFIDLGLKNGLEVGNTFSIWRRSQDEENVPGYKIGNLIIVRVGDKTATALITNASRTVYAGDLIISDVR